jgi:hypothetical protein
VAVVGLSLFGLRAYSDWRVGSLKFDAIQPGEVNILGVDTSAGYRVVVANGIAQLLEVDDAGFGGRGGDTGPTDGAIKKRIPIREMLRSLQGNEEALSDFVMVLNDIKTDRLPPEPVYWKAAELEQALSGADPGLERRLVADLNINLDGSPIDRVSVPALEKGIVIQAPVLVNVSVSGEKRQLTGTVLQEYRPRFTQAVHAHYREKLEVTSDMIRGYYLQEARGLVENPAEQEDVRKSILSRIDSGRLQQFARRPEQVLGSIRVLVNERFITDGSYRSYNASTGRLHDLMVGLTPEGRDRLWQYSKGRINHQLLLIVNGIAIAAPRIQHELAQNELSITQMPDEVLVREAVDLINQRKNEG